MWVIRIAGRSSIAILSFNFSLQVAGNLALKYGSVEEANRFARALPGQVYLYNFDYVGPPSPVTPGFPYDFPNTVGHGDELKFLFPMSNVLNEEHTQMAKIMVGLWTSFAITGKPQADNVMPWPTVSSKYYKCNLNIIPDFFNHHSCPPFQDHLDRISDSSTRQNRKNILSMS